MAARSVNRIILVGEVGRDPELRDTAAGKTATISVRTTRPYLRAGEDDRQDWHRLVLHGRLASFAAEQVRKGDRIYVEGSLEYGSYERDGISYPTAEVVVSELVLLSPSVRLVESQEPR